MTTLRTDQVVCGSDGAMDLHIWTPEQAPRAAILVIQEIFGVGPYIRSVAERLASAGYLVGAPDLFWRFAPNWESDHSPEGLGASFEKVQQLDFPKAISDCVAALSHLRAQPGIAAAPGVLGFCLGGTVAWGVAASAEPSCCVSYYGSGVPSMLEMIDQVSCPTLFHFGNADSYIPSEGIDAVSAAIAGRPGFVLNVENAGHAFDNHESEMFYNENAARAAWTKTMAFLATHLPA
jgi:carboxymethylenebutenolidase